MHLAPEALFPDRDGHCLLHASLGVLDGEGEVACRLRALHHDYQLAVEQAHGGLGERLQRRGIAIAYGPEGAGAADVEAQLVGGSGDEGAALVDERDGDEGQVLAVGLQRGGLLGPGVQLQVMGLAGGAYGLFSAAFARFIVDDDLEGARFVLHVVPSQAVSVQAVFLGKCLAVELPVPVFFHFLDASLALAVDEELGFVVVGIAVDGSDLAPTLLAPGDMICPLSPSSS